MKCKKVLSKIREYIVEQIWRIQIIQGLYGVLVFTPLLILANSEKIQKIIPLNTYMLVMIGTPTFLFCVWLAGSFLDAVIKYQQIHYTVANKRNPQIIKILAELKKINERLDKK